MRPFLMLGATKTGTSTAVAIANTNPDIFCFYDCDFSKPSTDARNPEVTALLPNCADLFQSDLTIADTLKTIQDRAGWNFQRVGLKVAGIFPHLLDRVGDQDVFFMVRDIRRWAIKGRVLQHTIKVWSQADMIPTILAYTDFYLRSFLLPNCTRLTLESVLTAARSGDLSAFPKAVARFLGVPPDTLEAWWTKADWRNHPPKNYSSWSEGHASAFLPPVFSDSDSVLNDHAFWRELLPIFDKYFARPEQSFSAAEVAADLTVLSGLSRHSATVDDLFESFRSVKVREIDSNSGLAVTDFVQKKSGQSFPGIAPPSDREV